MRIQTAQPPHQPAALPGQTFVSQTQPNAKLEQALLAKPQGAGGETGSLISGLSVLLPRVRRQHVVAHLQGAGLCKGAQVTVEVQVRIVIEVHGVADD